MSCPVRFYFGSALRGGNRIHIAVHWLSSGTRAGAHKICALTAKQLCLNNSNTPVPVSRYSPKNAPSILANCPVHRRSSILNQRLLALGSVFPYSNDPVHELCVFTSHRPFLSTCSQPQCSFVSSLSAHSTTTQCQHADIRHSQRFRTPYSRIPPSTLPRSRRRRLIPPITYRNGRLQPAHAAPVSKPHSRRLSLLSIQNRPRPQQRARITSRSRRTMATQRMVLASLSFRSRRHQPFH